MDEEKINGETQEDTPVGDAPTEGTSEGAEVKEGEPKSEP